MIGKKDAIAAFLVGCWVMALLFAVLPTKSADDPNYSPWTDLNDDGVIDSTDLGMLGTAWGSFGDPITKAGLLYDSGWIDISDKAGQYFDVVHNLNSADVIVDVTGKTTADGGVHQKYFGGTDFVAGWNKTYGGTGFDNVPYSGLIQTKDGGYALGLITDLFTPSCQAWLVKTDARGSVQWNRTYGEAGDQFNPCATPLVQTADGGYALAFMRKASGAGSYDSWLVRTDAFGAPLWNLTYGGAGDEYVYSMIQTREGGFALVGITYPGDNGYLVVVDSVGNMLWSQVYGGNNGDCLNDIVQTGDGFAMAGWTYSYGAGDVDTWLVKTNASGDMQWNKTYGTWAGEDANALIQTFDGGYAIAGSIHYGNPSARDMWFVKTDASGNMQWSQAYGEPAPGHEIATDVVQTSDGGYALVCIGPPEAWLIKTDSSGNEMWRRLYGGTGTDQFYCLIMTADGGYAMAGYTDSYGASSDAWLIKTDAAGNVLDGFKYGLACVDSTANSITLYRGTDDAYWNYVRVRIWQIKQNP